MIRCIVSCCFFIFLCCFRHGDEITELLEHAWCTQTLPSAVSRSLFIRQPLCWPACDSLAFILFIWRKEPCIIRASLFVRHPSHSHISRPIIIPSHSSQITQPRQPALRMNFKLLLPLKNVNKITCKSTANDWMWSGTPGIWRWWTILVDVALTFFLLESACGRPTVNQFPRYECSLREVLGQLLSRRLRAEAL